MAVQLWQVVVWVLGVPYVLWYLWQELLTGKRQAKRERLEQMEANMLANARINFSQWKHCIGCGTYVSSSSKYHTEHTHANLLVPIDCGELMRAAAILVSDAVLERLPFGEREQFGLYFLQLEALLDRHITSEQALKSYNYNRPLADEAVSERTSND